MLAIFLDIETTGLDPFRHRAIDLALKVMDVTSGQVKGIYQSLVKHPQEVWDLRDLKSMKINGYGWDQVVAGKAPEEVKNEIIAFFQKCGIERGKAVFICQNCAFDRSFFAQIIDVSTQEKLNWPYHWLDFASMNWALLVKKTLNDKLPFPESLNLSKNEVARLHNIPPEETPHRAMQGVEHLILCYDAVIGLPKNASFG